MQYDGSVNASCAFEYLLPCRFQRGNELGQGAEHAKVDKSLY